MRRLCTMKPVSIASSPSAVGDPVRVGVAAEPGVGLVERDVGGARRDVRSGQSGDTGADDRDSALAAPPFTSPR